MTNIVKYPAKPKVFGTGLVALDIVISADENNPCYQWAGGTCGNVLTILSYLGLESFPVARLNVNETSSKAVLNDFARWGVMTEFSTMKKEASVPVITQEIALNSSGVAKHKFHWRNCPKCGNYLPNYSPVTLKATQEIKESVKSADLFFFDRVSPGALDLARHFKSIGALVFFEPSAKGDPKKFEEAISLSDIVKYSDQRFDSLSKFKSSGSQPFLEIQTLGENGLRYLVKGSEDWAKLAPVVAENVLDTCGCGDWTTAGIISRFLENSKEEIFSLSAQKIREIFHFGQALGAWNCSFEGARGGMYEVTREKFSKDIKRIMQGKQIRISKSSKNSKEENVSDGLCPACPQA